MENSNELLRNLQKEMGQYRGSKTDVAARCNCSRDWVRLVLIGKYHDDLVLKVCAEVLKEYKEKRQDAMELIAQIVEA